MKTSLLLICGLFIPCSLFSQPQPLKKTGQEEAFLRDEIVREIAIEESGIHAISKNTFDTIVVDVNTNAVLYCYPDSALSFWYKIYAKVSCEITFDIFPFNADNTYNYFLYKKAGDLTIGEIKKKNIYPVRANLYKDKMETTGTGLSPFSKVNYNDTSATVRAKQLYHMDYHHSIVVKAGDVLMLNIYHVKGKDCGQQYVLKTGKYSQEFQSLYKCCYSLQLAKTKVKQTVNLPAFAVKANEQKKTMLVVEPLPFKNEIAKATYVVWDSSKHVIIPAEISWTKKPKGSYTVKKGEGEIVLEKNMQYRISFSALGYKSKTVSFATDDSPRPLNHYLFLTPVKEGEDFVMDKIYFYPNTYTIKPGAISEMDKLLAYLKSNPETKIEIQGYTNGNNYIRANDEREEGSFTGSSKKLSQHRAETIKKYLMEKGIDGERLLTNGYGGKKMIYPNPKNQEEANKNIRVGILILSLKEKSASVASKQ